jgi:hypothetical protein
MPNFDIYNVTNAASEELAVSFSAFDGVTVANRIIRPAVNDPRANLLHNPNHALDSSACSGLGI